MREFSKRLLEFGYRRVNALPGLEGGWSKKNVWNGGSGWKV